MEKRRVGGKGRINAVFMINIILVPEGSFGVVVCISMCNNERDYKKLKGGELCREKYEGSTAGKRGNL